MSAARLELVLATANPDKASEIRAIFSGSGIGVLARPESVAEVEESGATLVENARLKAVAVRVATGCSSVADDTGLEVAALGGAPGVYSSRFAGEDATYAENVAKLLEELAGTTDRRARFVAIAFVSFADGDELWTEGVVEGRIAGEPRGSGGFGYDPVFVPNAGDGRTFAEMSPEEKHVLSHRGLAFRALAARLATAEG